MKLEKGILRNSLSNNTIANEVIKLLSDYIESNNITLDTEINRDILDSISFVRLVVAIEDKFGFEFEDNKFLLSEFQNVKSIVEYISTMV